jgi:phosphoglycerate dehydrogenase-like enzyme
MPPDFIQNEVQEQFPGVNFQFFKGFEAAKEAFYEAEVFITYGEDLNEKDIEKASQLKWIMVMSAGLDQMPLTICEEKEILVTNARGVHKIPMAEFTLSCMLQHVKQVNALRNNEQKYFWNRKLPMSELCGKTLLIVGAGAIGGEIARLGKAFRMNTIGINRSGGKVDYVDELYKIGDLTVALPKADFIVSVLPSTKETKHLLKLADFEQMKRSAVFINIGRGDLVEEEVLLQVFEQKLIAHAYLDVFNQEPLSEGSPFWKMDEVTVSPHLSSITKEYLPRSFDIFKHNLHIYMNNKDGYQNVIDYKRGY